MEDTQNQGNGNAIIVAIMFSTILIIGALFYFTRSESNLNINTDQIVKRVVEKVEEIEQQKYGGKENYELVKQLYSLENFKLQQKQSLQSAIEQIKGNNEDNGEQGEDGTKGFKQGVVNKEKIDEIKKLSYLKGNENSKILWLEYSDVECPFCKRFHQAGTVGSVMAAYSGSIAYGLQHYPLPIHPLAQKGAESIECVGEIDSSKIFQFQDKIFNLEENPTIENIKSIVTELKIDSNKFISCLDSGKYAGKVKSVSELGSSLFSVTGTPGNVIINTETGKWILIPGAYPASEIQSAIEQILN